MMKRMLRMPIALPVTKALTALVFASMMVSVSIIASPTCVYGEPSVGVKKGDWIEYSISMTGPPLDSLRNLTSYRIQVLEVDGAWFKVNKTALTVNGTRSSSVWSFNLTEGQVQGWVIIPANLSIGDAFFDAAKSANITIEGEEQKTVLGARRTVTHASDPGKVYKEWDKVTGFYVHAVERTTNYTVTTTAIATNIWSPQTLQQNPINSYHTVAVIIVLALLILFSALFIARKKTSTAFILASIIVSVSIITSPALAYGEPSVGVEEGDWIEYNISLTGTGALPPTHDVRWMRFDILKVEGAAFLMNLTARYANGTLGSAIWKFNFTEGNVGGWMIIPANLGPGETFYDLSMHTGKPVNVTILRQEQKTLLGATRTVTYGNDSLRHKEWDKTTGVFVGSSEHLENVTNKAGWYFDDLTVNVNAVATNMWMPQVENPHQTVLPLMVAVTLLPIVISYLAALTARKQKTKIAVNARAQRNFAILAILVSVSLTIIGIMFFPFSQVGLTFAEINLIMQTFWTALVFVSMWFRMKGNYFVHEITMLVVVCAWFVGFSAVLAMGPLSMSSLQSFSSSPMRLVMNGLHAIFSIPALVFGVWLVALWRPGSTTFAAKSKRIAQLTAVFWVPSYVVGILDFMVLHTTFFSV